MLRRAQHLEATNQKPYTELSANDGTKSKEKTLAAAEGNKCQRWHSIQNRNISRRRDCEAYRLTGQPRCGTAAMDQNLVVPKT
jgi:hypothetical protein